MCAACNFGHYLSHRKGNTPVTVRQKLTDVELTLAFIVGGGLTLLILGFLLMALQAGNPRFDPTSLNVLMVVGGFLAVAGAIAWFVLTRPWKNFDDWSTPLYTGHDAHHDPAATHGQAIAEAKGAEHEDNLTTISGITPKILSVLNNVGIYTYAQLAARQPAELERVIRDSGVRISTGSAANWINQAKAASTSTSATASH
jgi:hypothetical protein